MHFCSCVNQSQLKHKNCKIRLASMYLYIEGNISVRWIVELDDL